MPSTYREYFDIDQRYFPCIDAAAIDAGASWENTYPHETFINMLSEMERALARQNNGKTLWIEGAYGTGKSQCAFALKKILEVPEEELRAYWNRFDALKTKRDLCEKLIGHKKNGIVVAYRYASGDINSARNLFFAIQESVKEALLRNGTNYLGENTIKESIIAWLDDNDNKAHLDRLLANPEKEWKALFSQSTADEVIKSLKSNGDVKQLVDNIFTLADKEGITALSINSDKLIAWLTDVIDTNSIKIVLIWDEFSDYFKNNKESLSEFQKIASLVQSKPFYFIVVTHETQSMYVSENDRGNQSKVSDRFKSIPITLPDNIAFNLIGHAFNVKEAAKERWNLFADDLNARITNSRNKVMAVAKITDPKIIKGIMPIHPMAALILKNIASAFKSNQRSMFDFIKTNNDEDVKAFQYFIDHTGPLDSHPLLTVDMLWDFFYEKGRDNLTADIRLILDTFQQQKDLRDDEQAVLKAILIMQAIDQRLGGTIDLFKATNQNLGYVFEGIDGLDGTKSANIARGLRDKGILVSTPINGGEYAYSVAVLAGDQSKIDSLKKEIKKSYTTSRLVVEGELNSLLQLPPALRLRFESEPGTGQILSVTTSDFKRRINELSDSDSYWKINAVIAFAKDERESYELRGSIKDALADPKYKNIVFIDALSTPLGDDAFEQFAELSALSSYHQGNQNAAAREYSARAKHILAQDWRNRIYNGTCIVYTFDNPEGDKQNTAQGVASVLQKIVTNKHPYVFDFAKGLTEAQLKQTPAIKQSAKCGINQLTSGVVVNIEKNTIPEVWNVENYWMIPAYSILPISKIKVKLEGLISSRFEKDGQISIAEIYNFLEKEYGFAPCNLTAFILGFLLKEYKSDPFRFSDSIGGHGAMTDDKLAEIIANHIKKPSASSTSIVKMTAEEKSFYTLTEKCWNIPENSCVSVSQAITALSNSMRKLLPVWTLSEIDSYNVFPIVNKYIELIQKEGNEAHKIAIEIGKIAIERPSVSDNLKALISSDNCRKGMLEFLQTFEDGKIIKLANIIGIEHQELLKDIGSLFSVKHAGIWGKEIGQDEICKLATRYGIIKESNTILNSATHSFNDICNKWNERLNFLAISCEYLQENYKNIEALLSLLLRVFKREDLMSEQLVSLHKELLANGALLKDILNSENSIFADAYAPYLEELSIEEIREIKNTLETGLFALPITECNIKVKNCAEEFRKNQIRTQLIRTWKEKTGKKSPTEWSEHYKTPILSMIPPEDYDKAKSAFDIINRNGVASDIDIQSALEYLKNSDSLFDMLSQKELRDDAFKKDIIGHYAVLLPDVDKVREKLQSVSLDVYEWRGNPTIAEKIKQMAEAEYNSGGSNKVLSKVDKMTDAQLKEYLKKLIKDNVVIGIEILMGD